MKLINKGFVEKAYKEYSFIMDKSVNCFWTGWYLILDICWYCSLEKEIDFWKTSLRNLFNI